PGVDHRRASVGEVGHVAGDDGQAVDDGRGRDESVNVAPGTPGSNAAPFTGDVLRNGEDAVLTIVSQSVQPARKLARLARFCRPDQFYPPFDLAQRDDAHVDLPRIGISQPACRLRDALVRVGKNVRVQKIHQRSSGVRLGVFRRLVTCSTISSGHSGPDRMWSTIVLFLPALRRSYSSADSTTAARLPRSVRVCGPSLIAFCTTLDRWFLAS